MIYYIIPQNNLNPYDRISGKYRAQTIVIPPLIAGQGNLSQLCFSIITTSY